MDFAADLDRVFFAPPFAFPFLRVRPATAAVDVWLIVGIEDDTVLDGRAVAQRRTAHFAAGKDVRVDDVLVAVRDVSREIRAGDSFRVIEPPRRVNDGMEMEALLSSVKTA